MNKYARPLCKFCRCERVGNVSTSKEAECETFACESSSKGLSVCLCLSVCLPLPLLSILIRLSPCVCVSILAYISRSFPLVLKAWHSFSHTVAEI